jgi:hypothetical protein
MNFLGWVLFIVLAIFVLFDSNPSMRAQFDLGYAQCVKDHKKEKI